MRLPRDTWRSEWDRADLEAQRQRLRTVPLEARLEEVIAWSAALLADDLARSGGRLRPEAPAPVGLGSRRR